MIVKDFYEEKGVVAKPNKRGMISMWAMLGLAIVSLVAAYWVIVTLAVAIVAIIAFIVMFRERYIEYDYCFYNEEIEIAKIMNRKRRRTAIQFEMNNIRLIAPEGSIRLANERERYPQMRYTDYTSVEPTSPVYGFVLDLKGVSSTIMLEPTESMMDHLRQLVPNKIYED